MNRFTRLCLAVLIIAGIIFSTAGFTNPTDSVAINVNGQRIYPDSPPFIDNGRTIAPIAIISQTLGADVQWVGSERAVIINYHGTNIKLHIGSRKAEVNGVTKWLDAAPQIVNSRTMVPISFIAINMGMSVGWVPEARLATVTDPAYLSALPAKTVLGYTTNDYRGDVGSYNSVNNYHSSITTIATFSYGFDASGNLSQVGQPQQSTVDLANIYYIKPLVLIHNLNASGSFDGNLAHTVLADSSKRQALIHNILIVMSQQMYAGVNIDIENVSGKDRQGYSSFIKELKQTLSRYGFLTTAAIPAVTVDSPNNNWNGGFDYAQIGKYADQVMLMTYDEHYFGGSPGPVASLPWVTNVLNYATQQMPSNKILLGIAGYGYDWASSGNKAVSFKNIDTIITSYNTRSQWDDTSMSPYFTYVKDGVSHEVWYENAQSISAKLSLVNTYKLGGIGIWRLGYDNADFWNAVNTSLN